MEQNYVTVTLCIGNESAPIQNWHIDGSTGRPFPMLKFSNKVYRSNFVKQHSETVIILNYQNADCSSKKYCVFYYNFRQTFFRYVYFLKVVFNSSKLATFSSWRPALKA